MMGTTDHNQHAHTNTAGTRSHFVSSTTTPEEHRHAEQQARRQQWTSTRHADSSTDMITPTRNNVHPPYNSTLDFPFQLDASLPTPATSPCPICPTTLPPLYTAVQQGHHWQGMISFSPIVIAAGLKRSTSTAGCGGGDHRGMYRGPLSWSGPLSRLTELHRLPVSSSPAFSLHRVPPLFVASPTFVVTEFKYHRLSGEPRKKMEDQQHQQPIDKETLEKRPGIFMIGSLNVGKRTLLSRLLSVDFEDFSYSSFEVHAKGWTIDTKYYTADVSVWMAHLQDVFALGSFPQFQQLAALVMVFDLSDISSLTALKEWVSHTDIQKFDILICIGNKVDLLPGHPAHIQYRRRLLKLEDTILRSDEEFLDYGISETEGTSLLGDEEPSWDVRRSCLEWCTEHNIEYIEACGSNVEFDRCLSVDGDSQGLERLFGALSAHMWPGMILKNGNQILQPSLPERQDFSEEESDIELEYEILSAGSAEPWDDTEEGWVSATNPAAAGSSRQSVAQSIQAKESNQEDGDGIGAPHSSVSVGNGGQTKDDCEQGFEDEQAGKGAHFELEELEQLMSEIGNVRDSIRLMPDFQRREMAAKLAMRMANMFGGDSSGDEDGFKCCN